MLRLPDTDSQKFRLFWLLIIGGVLESFDAYVTGTEILKQGEENLAKFQAEHLALAAAVMGLARELIPVKVGLMLALLSPIIGVFEYLKIKKADAPEVEKRNLLISARIKSLFLASPILVVLGLIVSIGVAYWASSGQQSLSAVHPIEDFSLSVGKGLIFGLGLGFLGVVQIRAFFKWPKIASLIVVSVLVVTLNLAAIIFLDYGLTQLLYLMRA